MADKKEDSMRGTEVLGLGGVTPDRANRDGVRRDPLVPLDDDNKYEGVGTAGEVRRTDATGSITRTKGATGIDMGAGGEGTGIEP